MSNTVTKLKRTQTQHHLKEMQTTATKMLNALDRTAKIEIGELILNGDEIDK